MEYILEMVTAWWTSQTLGTQILFVVCVAILSGRRLWGRFGPNRNIRYRLSRNPTNEQPPHICDEYDDGVDVNAAEALAETYVPILASRGLSNGELEARSVAVRRAITTLQPNEDPHAKAALDALEKGNPLSAEEHLSQFAEARSSGDRKVAIRAFYALSAVAFLNDLARSRAALDKVIELNPNDLSMWDLLGQLDCLLGDLESAEAACERQLALARDDGDDVGQAIALHNIGYIALKRGGFKKAADCFRGEVSIAGWLGDKSMSADGLTGLGCALWELGDLRAARKHQERARELNELLGRRSDLLNSLINLGGIYRERGDLQSAEYVFEEALSLSEKLADTEKNAIALLGLGEIASSRGDLKRADDLMKRMISLCERTGDRVGIAMGLSNLAGIARERGNFELAEDYLQRSLAISDELNDYEGVFLILCNLGSLARKRGRLADALDRFQKAREICVAQEFVEKVDGIDRTIESITEQLRAAS